MSFLTFAHATALSGEEQRIFEHALALAAAADARLVSVHARDGGAEKPPLDAASVLAGWGQSDKQIAHETLQHTCCEDPIDTLLDALRQVAPDLIIAGTHQKSGAARLLAGSQCEALLRNVTEPTLVFPMNARSFLDERGQPELRKMVIPIGDEASAEAGLFRAQWLADMLGISELDVELIYVGDAADAPNVTHPNRPGWNVTVTTSKGNVVDAVAAAASDACLLVMATRGADSLKDSLLGTNTERVLRTGTCPVMITPMTH